MASNTAYPSPILRPERCPVRQPARRRRRKCNRHSGSAWQDGVFIRARDHLLENRICDAVIDHQLLLPCAVTVGGIDLVEHRSHFFCDRFAKLRRRVFQSGFDQRGILFDAQIRVLVFVVDDPTLALGDDLVAELFRRKFVSPLAKCAFGELLNVAFVHQRDALKAIFSAC